MGKCILAIPLLPPPLTLSAEPVANIHVCSLLNATLLIPSRCACTRWVGLLGARVSHLEIRQVDQLKRKKKGFFDACPPLFLRRATYRNSILSSATEAKTASFDSCQLTSPTASVCP